MANNLFGREVQKDSYKVQTTDGYKKVKSKVVFDKNDDIVKTKSKETRYTPTGNENGKLSEYKTSGTTVQKRTYEGGSSVPKKTIKREGIIPVKKVDYTAIPSKSQQTKSEQLLGLLRKENSQQKEAALKYSEAAYNAINFKNRDIDKFKLDEFKLYAKPKP